MAVAFELPFDIEQALRRDVRNLDQAAKEAALVELYRQDKLTQHELSLALGSSRMETEALLKKHNVTEDLPTVDEYDSALARLRENRE